MRSRPQHPAKRPRTGTSIPLGRFARNDNGAALIMVMVSMTILTLFATVALTYSTQTLKTTRHTQDFIAALAAAQAGVDEYLARLNQQDAYWQTPIDCTNPAMRKPLPAGTACGWTPTTALGWATIPGTGNTTYHYDADTTATPVDGTIDLKVTGKANTVNRTIQVTLRRAGFGEFLYYTDYETIDPANEAIYGYNNTTAFDKCAHYYWEPNKAPSKPRDTTYCSDIQFITGDVINGPTHSNDAIKMGGNPEFKGNVSTAWPNCRPVGGVARPPTSCYRPVNPTNPKFDKGISYRDPVALPTSLGSLRQYVAATATRPGCLYTGPTRIKFVAPTAAGNPGTMKVWSPWSQGTLNPGCGNAAAPWPQTMNIPTNNIIIVQDVPSGQTQPRTGTCADGSIGDGYPQNGDINQGLRDADCRYGTAYIEGPLAGKLTISADNNIIITGDLTYNSGTNGTDVLGLIATNSVKIYHPYGCIEYDGRGRCTANGNMDRPNGTKFTNPTVQAAILTLQHSFTVQSYQLGSSNTLGSIHLFGSFSQKYRGPVGTSNNGTPVSGYLKDYVYDTRLRYAPPPYFLDPIHASWGGKTFGELQAAYAGQ